MHMFMLLRLEQLLVDGAAVPQSLHFTVGAVDKETCRVCFSSIRSVSVLRPAIELVGSCCPGLNGCLIVVPIIGIFLLFATAKIQKFFNGKIKEYYEGNEKWNSSCFCCKSATTDTCICSKKSRHNLQRLSKTDQTAENAILGYGVTWSSRLVDWPMRESITPV